MNARCRNAGVRSLPLLLWGIWALPPSAFADGLRPTDSLDLGYRQMYELDFQGALGAFAAWQRSHPADPLGPASEAAGTLFSELNRLGILEAQFFVEDESFLGRKGLRPDPDVRARFDAALRRSDVLARARIATDPRDTNALFALTLVSGLQADYLSLIDNRNLAALGPTRRATEWAQKLLAVDPDYGDAYLATGLSKYLMGSSSAPVRWILGLGGFSSDKRQGIRELEWTVEKGRYLAPFARLLLAIAYLRENDRPRARRMLEQLRAAFPRNPLYSREIARIDAGRN
jgi:tetratricopeptide (TPR) repeat protein